MSYPGYPAAGYGYLPSQPSVGAAPPASVASSYGSPAGLNYPAAGSLGSSPYSPYQPQHQPQPGMGYVAQPHMAAPSPPMSTPTATAAPAAAAPVVNASIREWGDFDKKSEREFQLKNEEFAPLEGLLKQKHQDYGIQQKSAEKAWIEAALKETPPAGYTGPHLSWPLNAETVQGMVQKFKTNPNVPLHRRYAVELLLAARDMLSNAPSLIQTTKVNSGQHQKLVVVGDLHGQLSDLLTIFNKNGYPDPQGAHYLFNGDFVDRGPNGVEIVLTLLAFKLLYPNSVQLNRGNHEDHTIQRHYGFNEEVTSKYGRGHMFPLFSSVFKWISLATVIDDIIFVVHGGLTRYKGISIQHLKDVSAAEEVPEKPRTQEEFILGDMLWSDPSPKPGVNPSQRGPHNIVFGPDITAAFIEENKLKLVIRSHEVPENGRGFEFSHDKKVVTLFSASNYCGTCGNKGAVMVFTTPTKSMFMEYVAPPLEKFLDWEARGNPSIPVAEVQAQAVEKAERDIVQQVMGLVAQHRQDIYWFLKKADRNNTGKVSVVQWQQAMMNILNINLPWSKYQDRLVKISADGLVDYQQFVDQVKYDVDPKFKTWQDEIKRALHDSLVRADLSLTELKQRFDQNSDGTVDERELANVLNRLNLGVTPRQVEELLRGSTSAGHNGSVDVLAFIEALQIRGTYDEETEQALQSLSLILQRHHDSLVKSFQVFDVSGDGKLQYNEFTTAMARLIESPESAECLSADVRRKLKSEECLLKVAKAIDSNASGAIDYMEFVDALKRTTQCTEATENVVQHICNTLHAYRFSLDRAFDMMDVNGDGYLTPQEFADGLRAINVLLASSMQLSDSAIEAVAKNIDIDGDGKIEYQEFLRAFRLETKMPENPVAPVTPAAASPPAAPTPGLSTTHYVPSPSPTAGGYTTSTGIPSYQPSGYPQYSSYK